MLKRKKLLPGNATIAANEQSGVKKQMRIFYLLFAAVTLACCSCHKDKKQTIVTGTVVKQGGYSATSYLVTIDNPQSGTHTFICNHPLTTAAATYHCGNSIFIVNLPTALRLAGKKMTFSRYKDLGANIVSSALFIPHDVEVYDAVEIR